MSEEILRVPQLTRNKHHYSRYACRYNVDTIIRMYVFYK